MKIEEGKKYVTRNGAVVGPMIGNDCSEFCSSYRFLGRPGQVDGACAWTEDGNFWSHPQEDGRDLVAEYVDRTPQQLRRIDEIPVLIARLEAERAAIQAACNHPTPQPIAMSCVDRIETDCPDCGKRNIYYREIK